MAHAAALNVIYLVCLHMISTKIPKNSHFLSFVSFINYLRRQHRHHNCILSFKNERNTFQRTFVSFIIIALLIERYCLFISNICILFQLQLIQISIYGPHTNDFFFFEIIFDVRAFAFNVFMCVMVYLYAQGTVLYLKDK